MSSFAGYRCTTRMMLHHMTKEQQGAIFTTHLCHDVEFCEFHPLDSDVLELAAWLAKPAVCAFLRCCF